MSKSRPAMLSRTSRSSIYPTLLAVLALLLLGGTRVALAQTCPNSSSTTTFDFTPTVVGYSTTQTVNLAPCETLLVKESHDMGGDGNRGTDLKVSYLNSDGQELFSTNIWGFYTGNNTIPDSYSEPVPWVGVRAPSALPATIKVESVDVLGNGNPPSPPTYHFTITRSPRPRFNVGGYSFETALLAGAAPLPFHGSVREAPTDPGQYFKIHLEGGESLYATGAAFEETYYSANFTVDVYSATGQLLTPNGWVNTNEWQDHPATFTSPPFTNPSANPDDFYVRVWSKHLPVEYFKITFSTGSAIAADGDVGSDNHPVIFIPGIMGSVLVEKSNNNELWPGFGKDHSPLSLNPNDHPSPTIVATDAIRRQTFTIPLTGVSYPYDAYGTLLEKLADPGGLVEYQVNNDETRRTAAGCDTSQRGSNPTLFVFAYDWRKGSAENAQKLQDYVLCVQQFHPSAKVTLLAHSMGGLVARRYILEYPGTVNQLITIASPWVGAPKGPYVLETGRAGFPLAPGIIWWNTLRRVAEFSKGVHELMPSRYYFDLGGLPFRESGDYNRNGIKNEVYNYQQLMNTLNARHDPRSTPGTNNQTFHDFQSGAQDDWRNDQTGVQYEHILGEKQALDTIGQVVGHSICVGALSRCYYYESYDLIYTYGDGTVPSLSAHRRGENGLNLNAPNSSRWYFKTEYTRQPDDMYEHNGLTKNPIVWDVVLYLLGRGEAPATHFVDEAVPPATPTPTPTPSADNTSFYLKVTGVDYVSVTDAAGNTNQKIDDTFALPVPDVGYYPVGDKSVAVTAPASQTYTYDFQSDGGPVALELVKGYGNQSPLEAVRYMDVQIPAGVKARIQTSAAGRTDLRYDADGDGVYETVVQPTAALTGDAAKDITPPTVTFTATQQPSGVLVAIAAQDSESGVKSLVYSLDGSEYQPYTQPFLVNPAQTPNVYAYADDNAANRSQVETLKVPIRKALLVVGSTTPGEADITVKTRLEDLGFAVTIKDAPSSASTDASGQDLIVISSTAAPQDVGTKFRDVAAGVLIWQNDLLDEMGMAGSVAGTDFGSAPDLTDLTVSDAAHPLAAGLSGTVTVTGMTTTFGWAVPDTGAHKVMTLSSDASKAAVFGYDAGAAMPGLTAPGRRAALFLTEDAVSKLNSNGWAIFNAAALWASGVTNSAPNVSITQPSGGQFFNPGASVTVNADASDSDGRVSKVEFYANTTLLGTATTSPYSFTWSGVLAGSYALTAIATDDSGATTTSSPVSITVNEPPAVSVTAPADGAQFVAPASINISADASDADGIAKVEFFQNGVKIGEADAAPYQLTWGGAAAGTYSLTAKATDNAGSTKTSSPVNVTVNAATNASAYVSQSVPATMIAGHAYGVSVTLRNTGDTTWTTADSFSLGPQNPQDNSNWGGRVSPPSAVAPGAEVTFNWTVTAPSAPGTYNFQWRMVKGDSGWFGDQTPNVAVGVTQSSGTGLKGEYFNNKTLTGASALTRTDSAVNFDWGGGSPDPAIQTDNFSALWTGQVEAQYSETYTFYTTSDDGVRLWVNNQPLVDDWNDHGSTEDSGTITLVAGQKYDIRMEYHESGGGAVAKLWWSSLHQPKGAISQSQLYPLMSPDGAVRGTIIREYWNNISGTAVTDLTGNSNYPNNPSGTLQLRSFEAPTDVGDNYGARVRGFLYPPQTGSYTFWVASDDTSELWLSTDADPANKVLIARVSGWTYSEQWTKYAEQQSQPVTLQGGQKYYVEALHKEGGGGDNLAVAWQPPGGTRGVISGIYLSPFFNSNPPTVSINSPANQATFTAPVDITINADAADSDGTISKVEFYQGTNKLGEDTTAPYSFTWANVPVGSYALTAKAIDNSGDSTTSAAVNIVVNVPPMGPLPGQWASQDIGSVGVAGDAGYSNGVFVVKGSGSDIEGSADAFRYVYQQATGDVQIIARVASLENTNSWAKIGVMIREGLSADSRHTMMALTPGNGLAFQRRVSTGGSTSSTSGGSATAPYWVKLVRAGDVFSAYKSADGVSWTLVGSETITMSGSVYVGLAVTSHSNGVLNTSTLDGVAVTAP